MSDRKYGCSTIREQDEASAAADERSSGTDANMNDAFFASNLKRNEEGGETYSLELPGTKCLRSPVKRHFQNWDVPYLSVYLSKNPKVTGLNLSHNAINSAGFISLIDYINAHQHIEQLDLRYNQVAGQGIKHLYHHRDKLRLRVLKLSGNKMGAANAKMLASSALRLNSTVQRLEVADVDQSEASLAYYAAMLRHDGGSSAALRVLDISRPRSRLRSTSDLASAIGLALRLNATLEELHARSYSFSCHDLEELLENGERNATLRLLDLSCNNIGDHGVELISRWLRERRPALRALLLARNIVSGHGARFALLLRNFIITTYHTLKVYVAAFRALSRGVPFSKLATLDLAHNRLDDEGCIQLLHSLVKSPPLQVFRLYGNNVGHETAKIVKRMLLSGVLAQENIDVKIYEVDGVLHFAAHDDAKL